MVSKTRIGMAILIVLGLLCLGASEYDKRRKEERKLGKQVAKLEEAMNAQNTKQVEKIIKGAGLDRLLTSAVDMKKPGAVELLIAHGANVQVTEESGHTLLMTAVFEEDMKIARLLVDAGADPNAQDKKGRTALHWVVHWCRLIDASEYRKFRSLDLGNRIQILVELGVDPELTDTEGNTPVKIAMDNGDLEMAQQLLDAGAERSSNFDRQRARIKYDKERKEKKWEREFERGRVLWAQVEQAAGHCHRVRLLKNALETGLNLAMHRVVEAGLCVTALSGSTIGRWASEGDLTVRTETETCVFGEEGLQSIKSNVSCP